MDNSQPYIPISCSFYDYLEEAATLKQVSVIEFVENDAIIKIESRITTLFIKDKVEFMKLESGKEVRLDTLINFNGNPLVKNC